MPASEISRAPLRFRVRSVAGSAARSPSLSPQNSALRAVLQQSLRVSAALCCGYKGRAAERTSGAAGRSAWPSAPPTPPAPLHRAGPASPSRRVQRPPDARRGRPGPPRSARSPAAGRRRTSRPAAAPQPRWAPAPAQAQAQGWAESGLGSWSPAAPRAARARRQPALAAPALPAPAHPASRRPVHWQRLRGHPPAVPHNNEQQKRNSSILNRSLLRHAGPRCAERRAEASGFPGCGQWAASGFQQGARAERNGYTVVQLR